jgi:hypothetical protein
VGADRHWGIVGRIWVGGLVLIMISSGDEAKAKRS